MIFWFFWLQKTIFLSSSLKTVAIFSLWVRARAVAAFSGSTIYHARSDVTGFVAVAHVFDIEFSALLAGRQKKRTLFEAADFAWNVMFLPPYLFDQMIFSADWQL